MNKLDEALGLFPSAIKSGERWSGTCQDVLNAAKSELSVLRSRYSEMRNAINDVELALNGLEIDDVVRRFEGADDTVMVKLPLGALRQLGSCYPELNRIINAPEFESPVRPSKTLIAEGGLGYSEASVHRNTR